MAIIFTSTVVAAVFFYLYVLVQFRREEKRLNHGSRKTSTHFVPTGKAA